MADHASEMARLMAEFANLAAVNLPTARTALQLAQFMAQHQQSAEPASPDPGSPSGRTQKGVDSPAPGGEPTPSRGSKNTERRGRHQQEEGIGANCTPQRAAQDEPERATVAPEAKNLKGRGRWTIVLGEMGFSRSEVAKAVENKAECRTIRQAADWLCERQCNGEAEADDALEEARKSARKVHARFLQMLVQQRLRGKQRPRPPFVMPKKGNKRRRLSGKTADEIYRQALWGSDGPYSAPETRSAVDASKTSSSLALVPMASAPDMKLPAFRPHRDVAHQPEVMRSQALVQYFPFSKGLDASPPGKSLKERLIEQTVGTPDAAGPPLLQSPSNMKNCRISPRGSVDNRRLSVIGPESLWQQFRAMNSA